MKPSEDTDQFVFAFARSRPTANEIKKRIDSLPEDSYLKCVCWHAFTLASSRERFTSDDVRSFAEPPAHSPNVFSSAMLEARSMKIFRVVGYTQSARSEAKGRTIPVYSRGFERW
jgi:hypothetical protein